MDQALIPSEDAALVAISGMPDIASVRALECFLETLPQIEIKTTHLIHAGMYARTIFIPAGTMATGAELCLDNIGIMVGDLTVTTDDGTQRLTGFHVLPATKGHKRAGVAHADTWWTTVFKCDAQTVEDAENAITEESDRLLSRHNQLEHKQCQQ